MGRELGAFRSAVAVALAVAVACALCLAPQGAHADEGRGDARGPAISKYVEKAGDGDRYDLSLTVSADTSAQAALRPADIVFVVDTTESMTRGFAGATTRWEALADSLSQVMGGVSARGIDARYALVRFWAYQSLYPAEHAPNRDAEVVQGWTGQPDDISSVLGCLALGNATNYQAAFRELSRSGILSSSGHADAERVVVFLSDGEPNVYYDDAGYDSEDAAVAHALEHAKAELAAVGGMDAFYAVYMGGGTSGELALMQELADASPAANKGAYAAGSKDELLSALTEILGFEDLAYRYAGVSVVDELSDYVQVAPGATLRVSAMRFQDGPAGERQLVEVGFAEGPIGEGAALALPATALNGAGESVLVASYDPDGKRVTLAFPGGYVLEGDYVYKVAFTIEPTDVARAAFAASGYPDRGDEGTGATSADAAGFRSNRAATVRYDGGEAPYPHPVVQVSAPDPSPEPGGGTDPNPEPGGGTDPEPGGVPTPDGPVPASPEPPEPADPADSPTRGDEAKARTALPSTGDNLPLAFAILAAASAAAVALVRAAR